MHTSKCVHRRQFNIYIFFFLLKKRHLDKVDFWCSFFVCTLPAKQRRTFTSPNDLFLLKMCHFLVAFSCYWLKGKRYSTVALHLSLWNPSQCVHFISPYIQFPMSQAKSMLQNINAQSFWSILFKTLRGDPAQGPITIIIAIIIILIIYVFSTLDGKSMPTNWNVLLCNLQCAESPTHFFLNISSVK